MKLYLCEKPSLAEDIAKALDPSAKKLTRYAWQVRQGIVFALQGHVYQLYEPKEYNKDWGSWRMADLPMLPHKFLCKLSPDHKARIGELRTYLPKTTELISCGDPDQEGSLLVHEVIDAVKWTKGWKRAWWKSTAPADLQKALAAPRSKDEDWLQIQSAMARRDADWLVGMNGSRVTALVAQNVLEGKISVGRVQTPVLGLIVQREREILNFKPKDYFELFVQVTHAEGSYRAKWQPKAELLDPQKQVTDRSVVDAVVKAVQGKTGKVVKYEAKVAAKTAPMPHSLTTLQKLGKRFGMSPDRVLEVAQSLYEKKVGSYPRTEVQFFSDEMHGEAAAVLSTIAANDPSLADLCRRANTKLKHRCFNTAKCGSHTALQPTSLHMPVSRLTADEQKIYRVYCLSYIALFFPDKEWKALSATVECEKELFHATGQIPLKAGWAEVFGKADGDEDDEATAPLPAMKTGDPVKLDKAATEAKKTSCPARFKQSDLPVAMAEISKYVRNPEVKKLLEKDPEDPSSVGGLGTPATRSSIIKELLDKERNYLVVNKKGEIQPTEKGCKLIDSLPPVISSPDLAAKFEMEQRLIKAGKSTYDKFMAAQTSFVKVLVEQMKKSQMAYEGQHSCPKCKSGRLLRIKSGPKSKSPGRIYWICENNDRERTPNPCPAGFFGDAGGKPDFSSGRR